MSNEPNTMLENQNGDTDSDVAEFSNWLNLQRKLEADPGAMSDAEIEAMYGTDIPPGELRDLIAKNTFRVVAKDQRASARAKLRRRLFWLDRALNDVATAIDDVIDAPGRTNKEEDLRALQNAIGEFRSKCGFPVETAQPEVNIDYGMLDRLFNSETEAISPPDESTRR